jgi:putative peptide zinc metalloprotease protein
MKKINYWYKDDETNEIISSPKYGSYIKDKINNKYFHSSKFVNYGLKQMNMRVVDYFLYFFVLLTLVLYVFDFITFFVSKNYEIDNNLVKIVQSILFLLINIVLHELGHATILKIYGRKVGKVKFKMNFIFPTVCGDRRKVCVKVNNILPFKQ